MLSAHGVRVLLKKGGRQYVRSSDTSYNLLLRTGGCSAHCRSILKHPTTPTVNVQICRAPESSPCCAKLVTQANLLIDAPLDMRRANFPSGPAMRQNAHRGDEHAE